MRRITPASDERRISGSVKRGRPAKSSLVVEADADAVGHAAAAPGALVGRGLADRLDLQLLDLVAVAVALDARQPGVDHVADAGHGERGLGHVGRQHDARGRCRARTRAPARPATGARTAAGSRLRPTPGLLGQVLAQVLGRLADLALAGQEHQHVAAPRRAAPQLVDRIGDGVVQVEVAALLERAPALLHRVQAARHLDHRRRAACGLRSAARSGRRRWWPRSRSPSGRAGAAAAASGSRAGSRCSGCARAPRR